MTKTNKILNKNQSQKEESQKDININNNENNMNNRNNGIIKKNNNIIKKQKNNSLENINNKNANNIIKSNNFNKNEILPKNNNIIIPNIKNDLKTNKEHFVKRNSYSYKTSYDNNISNNKQKIKPNNENQRHNDGAAQSAKDYIKYLSERNRLLKEEKDKEIQSIQKQLDKFDSKKNFKNINKNNIYDIDYINNINNNYYIRNNNQFLKNKINSQISNSNLYNKNINIRRLSKLKEEYDQKYSFQPVINDNYRTDLTFNERLNIFNNLSKQKKEELKNNLSNLKADENGQEFFKPNLISKQYYSNISKRNNSNNINNNNNSNNNSIDQIENNDKIDVFSKNYLYYKKYNSNKEKLYNKYYYNYTNEPHIFSKIQSDKLLNEANNKAFCNLFNELDSDQDNLITSFNINLNNIPNNILKIIEPLLTELKEDNQSLNQDEFIKAMNKLFENISSIERRQLINEYNNRRQKNINDKNKYLNNYNHNLNNSRKNNSLIKKEKDNSINTNNYSSKRMITRSNITTDNNNFDNNYLSSRPKTPVYNMVKKNNGYNFFSNLNNQKSQKTIVNNNTNKLAQKHFMRIQKMMDDYSNKYKNTNNEKNLYNCFDKKINYSGLNNKIPKNNCRDLMLNENKKFSSINDCTFSNYIKNLN